jgi:arsenate reductase
VAAGADKYESCGGQAGIVGAAPVILFLCDHNSARSQMAEAFLRRDAGGRVEVISAGLEPRGVHPLAVRVMGEIGLDISPQRSKSVREFLGWRRVHFAIFVCRVREDKCPTVWPGAATSLFWPFADPAVCAGSEEARLAAFRTVRDQIYGNVRDWLKEYDSACEQRGYLVGS